MTKTLVLGASLNPNKYSHFVIQRLLSSDNQVFAIGSREGEINGIKITTKKIRFLNVHTVTLYLNLKRQKDYYNYIISLQPKRVIFNPGTENPEFYSILEDNNIDFEVACTLTLLATNQY